MITRYYLNPDATVAKTVHDDSDEVLLAQEGNVLDGSYELVDEDEYQTALADLMDLIDVNIAASSQDAIDNMAAHQDLVDSARSKLVAGDPLTEEEASAVVF